MNLHVLLQCVVYAPLLLFPLVNALQFRQAAAAPPENDFTPRLGNTQNFPQPALGGDLWYREKAVRLGSRPPSCYKKCDNCSPCVVVQVPAPPQKHRSMGSSSSRIRQQHSGSTVQIDSNYKPMSWKCKCGHRLFNP